VACEGRLVATEAELARTAKRDYEPARRLLERILADRRAKWEQEQLQKMRARGEEPKSDKWKLRYPEPVAPQPNLLPELPQGWAWGTLSQIGSLDRGKSRHRPRDDERLYGGPYPFIQTGDVKRSRGRVTSHTQTYSDLGLQQSRLWPEHTLCITIAANIAETGILTYPACFPDSVVGFNCNPDLVRVEYVELFLRTAKNELSRLAPATGQKNINLEVLAAVAIAIPPIREQQRIVEEASRHLSNVDEMESSAAVNFRRGERLRQSILKRAFEGRLVAQDPDDEPALVLLDRLRADRARAATSETGEAKGKRGRPKTMAQDRPATKTIIEALKEAKAPLSPEKLFSATGHQPETIDEFYSELKAGVVGDQIEEVRTGDDGVLLRVKQA
jgi:type I restriction enzyme S subunit